MWNEMLKHRDGLKRRLSGWEHYCSCRGLGWIPAPTWSTAAGAPTLSSSPQALHDMLQIHICRHTHTQNKNKSSKKTCKVLAFPFLYFLDNPDKNDSILPCLPCHGALNLRNWTKTKPTLSPLKTQGVWGGVGLGEGAGRGERGNVLR